MITQKEVDKINKNLQKQYDDAYGYDPSNTSIKARLFSRKRTNKKGLIKIEIEVMAYTNHGVSDGIFSKERRFTDTGIWVSPKNWNNKGAKLSKKEPNSESLTNTLTSKLADVQKYISSFGQQIPDNPYVFKLNLNNLRDLFPNQNKAKTLKSYIDDYVEFKKKEKTKPNTLKNFTSLGSRIKAYDEFKGRPTIMNEINILWSDEFNFWMINKKEYKTGTIGRTYKSLIGVLNHFTKRGLDISDDYLLKEFKHGSEAINEPYPLTFEQRMILKNEYWNDKNIAAKNMLIQLYTGMRHSDIDRIRPQHITKNTLKFIPKKTDKVNDKDKKITVMQPLSTTAKALFLEARNNTEGYGINNDDYNMFIGKVLKQMKIDYEKEFENIDPEQFTSHNFRDTFISIAIEKNVTHEVIMQWVGISSYNILKRYIKVTDDYHQSEMDKLE